MRNHYIGTIFGVLLLIALPFMLEEKHEHKIVETICFGNGHKCTDLVICNGEDRVVGHDYHRPATFQDSVKFKLIELPPVPPGEGPNQPKVDRPRF